MFSSGDYLNRFWQTLKQHTMQLLKITSMTIGWIEKNILNYAELKPGTKYYVGCDNTGM